MARSCRESGYFCTWREMLAVPGPLDLAHECWVDNPIPERLDELHVALPEWTARLYVDGHLSLIDACALIYPSQVHHAMNGPGRQLGGKLVVGAIERHERQGVEMQIRRRVAQIVRQPAGQR